LINGVEMAVIAKLSDLNTVLLLGAVVHVKLAFLQLNIQIVLEDEVVKRGSDSIGILLHIQTRAYTSWATSL
jgi:hypothetical protein